MSKIIKTQQQEKETSKKRWKRCSDEGKDGQCHVAHAEEKCLALALLKIKTCLLLCFVHVF